MDEIDGISPPIAIRQKNTTRNPRSTVATATEIHDYLRLLYARAGETWCPACDKPRGARYRRPGGGGDGRAGGGNPLVRAVSREGGRRKGEQVLKDQLFDLRKRGFTRLYQNARIFEFSTPESLLEIDFTQPVFVAGRSPGDSRRDAPAPRGYRRNLLPRGGRSDLRASAARRSRERLRFSERFACKTAAGSS